MKKMKKDPKQQYESNFEPDAPPENTMAPVSNLIIWIVALSPVLGVCLELAGLVLIGLPVPILPEIIVLSLSIYFAYADRNRLQAAGHDTSGMGPPWLVPVYLFKRARILKQKFTYLIVWCVPWVVLVVL